MVKLNSYRFKCCVLPISIKEHNSFMDFRNHDNVFNLAFLMRSAFALFVVVKNFPKKNVQKNAEVGHSEQLDPHVPQLGTFFVSMFGSSSISSRSMLLTS